MVLETRNWKIGLWEKFQIKVKRLENVLQSERIPLSKKNWARFILPTKTIPSKNIYKKDCIVLTNIFRACREYIDENLSINHSVPVMEITAGV